MLTSKLKNILLFFSVYIYVKLVKYLCWNQGEQKVTLPIKVSNEPWADFSFQSNYHVYFPCFDSFIGWISRGISTLMIDVLSSCTRVWRKLWKSMGNTCRTCIYVTSFNFMILIVEYNSCACYWFICNTLTFYTHVSSLCTCYVFEDIANVFCDRHLYVWANTKMIRRYHHKTLLSTSRDSSSVKRVSIWDYQNWWVFQRRPVLRKYCEGIVITPCMLNIDAEVI